MTMHTLGGAIEKLVSKRAAGSVTATDARETVENSKTHALVTAKPTSFARYEYSDTVFRSGLGGCEMPPHSVDAVFTWVNGSDPVFRQSLNRYKNSLQHSRDDALPERFRDIQQLRYGLRSIEKYAPWINQIWLVTNYQAPFWLNTTYPNSNRPRVKVVNHADIFTNHDDLPTFNSGAILANIHKIPGLSREFLYFDDDFALINAVCYSDFWTEERGYIMLTQRNLYLPRDALCPEKCLDRGTASTCDTDCNILGCLYDGGRCDKELSEVREASYRHKLEFDLMLFHKFMGKKSISIVYHYPVLINVTIMEALQQGSFKPFFEATSGHKIRQVNEIQFQTMYVNWVLLGGYKSTEKMECKSHLMYYELHPSDTDYSVFDKVRKEPKQFLCINDKLGDDGNPDAIRNVIRLYNELYPERAGFENVERLDSRDSGLVFGYG